MESKDESTQLPSDPETLGLRLFSIGHSDQELPQLIALLHKAGVSAVADVRSVPYSRRLSQFNKAVLENALREQDIAYVYLGHELGGRPRSRDLYDDDGRVNYERVRKAALFQRGLENLLRELDRHVLAMLCGEDDPLDCHRGLMITPALVEQGVRPRHLRKDGSVETTPEMEARLLKETKQARHLESSLFPLTPEEIREVYAEAYRLMAKKKAFRLESDDA